MTRPSLGSAAGVALAVLALRIGLGRLNDNSFFTHLATGRLILDAGDVPTADPYSFTAPGADWVVQSWLASVAYGAVEDLAGGAGLRALMAALTVAVFAVVWRLSRPAQGLLVRLAIGALVLGVAAGGYWAERPLLFGLLALGLTVLAAEDGLGPRWLLPVGSLWVNTHGSFPLGIVYLVVVIVGRRLDGEAPAIEVRALAWLAGGVAAGAIGPLGPRILLFPLELLQRQDLLSHVVEWQAPPFRSVGDRLFLLQVMVALLALVRRPRYRDGLVVAVFLAAALLGSRNVAVASLVFVPVLARAWPEVGSLRSDDRSPASRIVGVAAAALFVGLLAGQLGGRHFELSGYPVASLDYLEDRRVDLTDVRLGAPERVGNLLELRDGPRAEVFYDDRFDMYPEDVSDDVVRLLAGRPGSLEVLDRFDLDLVLWPRNASVATILDASPAWRVLRREPDWLLFCREGAALGPELPVC
ncbi:MAG: hypothetical protein Q8K58_07150 [Acidimicrobiales bacterium]|nr:hypothetical protein [Acidimicrobiales bacterium]